MLSSGCLALRQLLQPLVLRTCLHDAEELEILVLRHEFAILRRTDAWAVISRLDRLLKPLNPSSNALRPRAGHEHVAREKGGSAS